MPLPLLLLTASLAWSTPSPIPPEEAVTRVLTRMRASLRYAPDVPAKRGPHEWDPARVLAAGTVNGCVESAKAFFTLLRQEFPGLKAAYLDSFKATGPGGHAVVQVTGSDGVDFIVDAASFERLPGPFKFGEADLAAPVDVRKDRAGRVVQFAGRGDVYLTKSGGDYLMLVYPPGQVFDGPLRSQESFKTLAELEASLAAYAGPVDVRFLRDHGLILPFADAKRDSFIYPDPAGGLARYVVYGRFSRLPAVDDAESREPAARARHAR